MRFPPSTGLVAQRRLIALLALSIACSPDLARARSAVRIALPRPDLSGQTSVEAALAARRTIRTFRPGALTRAQLGQLLWAANGVTARARGRDLRTIPSAGALYPLDVYLVLGPGGARGIRAGVWRYAPRDHALVQIRGGDLRAKLSPQRWVQRAPAVILIAAEEARSAVKYGARGRPFCLIEAGAAAQSLFLQAVALGLGAGIAGVQVELEDLLGIPRAHKVELLMPVGRVPGKPPAGSPPPASP